MNLGRDFPLWETRNRFYKALAYASPFGNVRRVVRSIC